jgi:hypothetical protein
MLLRQCRFGAASGAAKTGGYSTVLALKQRFYACAEHSGDSVNLPQ